MKVSDGQIAHTIWWARRAGEFAHVGDVEESGDARRWPLELTYIRSYCPADDARKSANKDMSAVVPPSITKVCPTMNDAAPEHRNTASCATSAGSPKRPAGTFSYERSRAAAKVMAGRAECGSIINIGSLNNAIGLEGVSVYRAHKPALCQLAKSMSIDWVRYRIRVNALCPGFMLTPLSKPLWDDPQKAKWILDRSLLRRPGYPEELLGVLQLLASNAGSFITANAACRGRLASGYSLERVDQ